jgi:chromosome segregation ATPase
MSFNYIGNLGITRLKEIGKILRIPRYSTYKDPESLRDHIKNYLDENGSVKREHLRMIKMTKKKLTELTAHIVGLVNHKIKILEKKSTSITEVNDCDYQMEEKLAEIDKYRQMANICELDDTLKKSLKKYIDKTDSMNLKQVISRMLENEEKLSELASVATRDLDKCKEDAIAALEKAQNTQNSLQKNISLLDARLKEVTMVNDSDRRKLEEKVTTLSNNATDLRRQVDAHTSEALTLHTTITQLEAEKGVFRDNATRFEQELNQLRGRSEEILRQCESLRDEAMIRADKCDSEKEDLNRKFQSYRDETTTNALESDKRINKLIGSIQEISQSNDELVKKVTQSALKIPKLETELENCEELRKVQGVSEQKISELKKSEEDLSNKLKKAEDDFSRLSQELLGEKTKNSTSAETTSRALQDLAAATERNEALQTKLAQITRVSETCAQSLREAEAKFEKGQNKLGIAKETVIANLREVNANYNKCMEVGKRLKVEYDEINVSFKSEQEKSKDLAKKLKTAEISLAFSIKLRDEKNAKLQKSLDTCMESGKRLKISFDKVSSDFERVDKALQECEIEQKARGAKIGDFYIQLKNTRKESNELRDRLTQTISELSQLKQKDNLLKQENMQLKAVLETKSTLKGAVLNLVGK